MTQFIDTIISLIFVYFVFSNLASVLVEIWNHYHKKRHKDLESAIKRILDDTDAADPGYGDEFYKHAGIKAIKRNPDSLPAYISDEHFASVVIDIFAKLGAGAGTNFQNFIAGVRSLNGAGLRDLLLSLSNSVEALPKENQDDQLKANIKNWYNDYMDRVTGWFKRDLRKQLLIVAVPLTLIFNIDTFRLIETFYNDDELRDKMVLSAIEVSGSIQADSLRVRTFEENSNLDESYRNGLIKQGFDLLDSLNDVPLGWVGEDRIIGERVAVLMKTCSIGSTSYEEREDELKKKIKSVDRELKNCLQTGMCHVEFEGGKFKTYFEKEPCDCLTDYYASQDTLAMVRDKIAKDKANDIKNFKLKKKQFENQVRDELNYWNIFKENVNVWTIFGWAISVLAISRGASFWFDNLVKLVNARSAGIKPKAVK